MDPTNLNGTAKAIIAVAIIVFCYTTIVLLNLYGDKGSDIAKNTLWWCFSTPLAILAGIGFGSVLDVVKAKMQP